MDQVLVDNEIRVVRLDRGSPPPDAEVGEAADGETVAIVRWSLHRQPDNRRLNVSSTGSDASLIGFDLQVEILSDPFRYELTKGLVVHIHSYETVAANSLSSTTLLRAEATNQLRQEIIDRAYTVPDR